MINTINYRILHHIKNIKKMKVTAIINDDTIKDAMRYSKASTVTETLKIALNEYIRLQKLKDLSNSVREEPLKFEYTAEKIRNLNRD